MFGDDPLCQAQHTGPQVEFTGVLQRNAEVRHKPALDGLHTVPVVCMELKNTSSSLTRTLHAEQPFTDATRKQAEALAKTLTKGRVVTVVTPLTDVHVTLPHVDRVSLHQPTQEHSAP